MKSAIVAYVPVLHRGYLNFFAKYPEIKTLYLLDESLTHQWRSLQKDLRALPAEQVKKLIDALQLFEKTEIVTVDTIAQLPGEFESLVMPDEEINHALAEKYFSHKEIIFDSIFLRWDRARSLSHQEVEPDVTVSASEFDQQVMSELFEFAQHSSDWWRQTASALVKDGKMLARVKNAHVPFDQQQYVDGDPRAEFGSGEHVDLSSSLHAEGALIAEAARQGIETKGCWLYATTFPCPYCAPLVALSGVTKLFYVEGYSLIHGQEVLKAKGVEIIKVNLENQ